VTPPTVTSVLALIVDVPIVEELITTVQEPVAPAVVQLLGPTKAAGPASEKLIVVPAGAFAKPTPAPVFTFTCPVSVCVVPIGLIAVAGVTWMFASTNLATALPEFGAIPFVCTLIDTPLTVRVEAACAVTVPARFDVSEIVHCPLASVFAPAFVQVPAGAE